MTTSEILDRLPPHATDAEQCVIGSCLLVPEILDSVGWLKPAAFYNDHHQRMWTALVAIHKAGQSIDETALLEKLRERGEAETIGGRPYINECCDAVGSPEVAVEMAKKVQACANVRRTINSCLSVIQACYRDGSPSEVLKMAEERLAGAISELGDSNRGRKTVTLEEACLHHLEQIRTSKSGMAVTSTSLWELDNALGGGAGESEVIVIGGRPSHGKSMAALHWLDALASLGEPCAIINEETSEEQIADRQLKRITALEAGEWRAQSHQVKEKIVQHFAGAAPLFIVSNLGTAENACLEIDRLCRTRGVKTVCVDYLQLLKGHGTKQYEQVTDACQQLVRCSRRNRVRLILLCQLNREIEKRTDPTPTMADLKDSGQIEQDADVILFVQWPYRIDSSQDKSLYRIFVAKCKNRGVKKPVVEVMFNDERQMLKNMPLGENFDHRSSY